MSLEEIRWHWLGWNGSGRDKWWVPKM